MEVEVEEGSKVLRRIRLRYRGWVKGKAKVDVPKIDRKNQGNRPRWGDDLKKRDKKTNFPSLPISCPYGIVYSMSTLSTP